MAVFSPQVCCVHSCSREISQSLRGSSRLRDGRPPAKALLGEGSASFEVISGLISMPDLLAFRSSMQLSLQLRLMIARALGGAVWLVVDWRGLLPLPPA